MNQSGAQKTLPLAMAALGVVFGDIGTSPLYAYQTALQASSSTTGQSPLEVASLIVWSLLALVTGKYISLVMRADYRGEGGIFALLGLLGGRGGYASRMHLPHIVLMLLFGAALLYGDGMITPAISVLSAMEGLEVFDPGLKDFILPITVGVLLALFLVQSIGTGRLGQAFGGIMLVWFLTIGIGGAIQIATAPQVLAALNPIYAVHAIIHSGPRTPYLLGGAVLAITGVEALYADMGHFGRRVIALAWHFVVLPCLILNYIGQAATALRHPEVAASGNLFFEMVPHGWPSLALVVLATAATIIASQALISGVFSLTAQARDLGFLPRFLVKHTSASQRGQVYLPTANWILAVACLLLVVCFRTSSSLASAYGFAVIGTMLTTSIAFGAVVKKIWGKPRWVGIGITVVLMILEVPFFLSSVVKIPDGGWFPLVVAIFIMGVMLTWHKGKALTRAQMLAGPCSVRELGELLATKRIPHIPGTIVMVTSNAEPRYATARTYEWIRRVGCIRKHVVFLSLVSTPECRVDMDELIQVKPLTDSLTHVIAHHGYMQEPHAPKIIEEAFKRLDRDFSRDEIFFVLPKENTVEHVGVAMQRWQRVLFGWLSRNISYAPDYYFIPYKQIIEFIWMMRA